MVEYPAVCTAVEADLYPSILGRGVTNVVLPNSYYTHGLYQGLRAGFATSAN